VTDARQLLVFANETLPGRNLLEAIERHASEGDVQVTVIAPVHHPPQGLVVYEDTRRAAARRRLDKTVQMLRDEGVRAHGFVVDADPVNALRDAIHQLEPDEIIVSTHPQQKSGWLRRNAVDQMRGAAGEIPFEHVVVDLAAEAGEANVLVVANETVLGQPLLEKIRERAKRSDASFLIISPQSDDEEHFDEADRRLRRAVALLRGEGIDAHGQVSHPDPYTSIIQAMQDERVDELIVSTFPEQKSGWLGRQHLLERLQEDVEVPIEHVVVEASKVPA
jgi:hypothetical protein